MRLQPCVGHDSLVLSLLLLQPLLVLLPLVRPSILHERLEELVLLAFQELSPLSFELPQCFHSPVSLRAFLPQPLVFSDQISLVVLTIVAFFGFLNLLGEQINPLIGLGNLCLFPGQLAREAVFFGEARYSFDFEVAGARESRETREEVVVVFHERAATRPTYSPYNRRSVALAEDFVVRIESGNRDNCPVSVRLVVRVNAKEEAARMRFGSENLDQNRLGGLVGADLVNHAVSVRKLFGQVSA